MKYLEKYGDEKKYEFFNHKPWDNPEPQEDHGIKYYYAKISNNYGILRNSQHIIEEGTGYIKEHIDKNGKPKGFNLIDDKTGMRKLYMLDTYNKLMKKTYIVIKSRHPAYWRVVAQDKSTYDQLVNGVLNGLFK